jgi:hypothetical protein
MFALESYDINRLGWVRLSDRTYPSYHAANSARMVYVLTDDTRIIRVVEVTTR